MSSSTPAPSLFPVSSAASPSPTNNDNGWNSGGFGQGAGYFQTIVIGLVAGGVLALAVMALLYRRHRRRMHLLGHTRIVAQGRRRQFGGGRLEVDFGKEPELWDAQIGEKEGALEIESWQPLAVSMLPSEAPGVQMTFLIAMPDPSAPHSETPVVYDDDLEDLPPVQLAVADVKVPTPQGELQKLLPELTKKRVLLQSRGIGI